MQAVAYHRRRSAVAREREWRVEAGALVTSGASGRERRLAWRDVACVWLYAEPARGRPWRYVFEIRPKQGRRILIDNAHYLEAGAFEDRSLAYTLFVRAALAALAAANPKARALLGETQKRYFFLLIFSLVGFCALALALTLAPTPIDGLAYADLLKLGLVLLMAPVLWLILRAMPRGVKLEDVPARAFPPGS
jgi:hypothetical protein